MQAEQDLCICHEIVFYFEGLNLLCMLFMHLCLVFACIQFLYPHRIMAEYYGFTSVICVSVHLYTQMGT